MSYRFRSLLVTGGAGFIGCNFIRRVRQDYPETRIVNLDLLTYAGETQNTADFAGPGYTFVHADICDRALLDRVLAEHDVDTVVHFAAESHVDRSIAGPAAFIQSNVVGTFTLLEAALAYWKAHQQLDPRRCRFHHVSTDEVYGSLSNDGPAFTEATAYAPNSPYSASKAASDHLVRAYGKTYKLPVTTSNCSNNYGPFQHAEKFIPTVIRSCFEGRPIPIYGTGMNVRDWLHVDDHCLGILKVLERGHLDECYNLGGNQELSNLDLANRICTQLDQLHPRPLPYAELLSFVEDRLGHDWRYAVSTHKAETELGWSPLRDFDQGIRETILWNWERLTAAPARL